MSRSLNGLLFSRKVWIAVLGVITAIVSYYASVPQEVWLPIEALLLTLIVTICAEDVAEKRAGSTLIVNNLPPEPDLVFPSFELEEAKAEKPSPVETALMRDAIKDLEEAEAQAHFVQTGQD